MVVKVEGERERKPIHSSAAVLIEDQLGRLLLLKQASPEKEYKWGPPAGKAKPGEHPITTAIREAKEEIGVVIKPEDVVGIFENEETSGIAIVFRAKIVSGTITPQTGEILEARFFSIGEIEGLIRDKKLYKPEYNIPAFENWMNGVSSPLETADSVVNFGQNHPLD
jgi:ADP-ribose pyrophosphatase YjhB (NUDIX family)